MNGPIRGMERSSDFYNNQKNYFVTGYLPDLNYRYVFGQISSVAKEMGEKHDASPAVTLLLGEAMLGAFFLASHSIKQHEKAISVHLECSGVATRVIAFARSNGAVRAMPGNPRAEWDGETAVGKGAGILSVNRWMEEGGKVYSSSIEMRDIPFDRNLEEFLSRSEQIRSFIQIRSSWHQSQYDIAGYMFQALPGATIDDAGAVIELVRGPVAEQLLRGVGGVESNRAFEHPFKGVLQNAKILQNGQFFLYCECNRDKIRNLILAIGRAEAEAILEQEKKLEITCEFCKKKYLFEEKEVRALFAGG